MNYTPTWISTVEHALRVLNHPDQFTSKAREIVSDELRRLARRMDEINAESKRNGTGPSDADLVVVIKDWADAPDLPLEEME